jgi:hypothetical protein
MSENSTRPHSEKGVGPARRPSTRRIGFRIAQQAKMAQHEAETRAFSDPIESKGIPESAFV